MSTVLQLQAVLSKAARRLTAGELSEASGMTPLQVGKHIAQMVQYGSVSSVKAADGRRNLYFMTPEQNERFRERVRAMRWVLQVTEGEPSFCLPTDTWDIHDRLVFLRNVRDRTVVGENPMLGRVIEDYERTLRLREALTARRKGEQPSRINRGV